MLLVFSWVTKFLSALYNSMRKKTIIAILVICTLFVLWANLVLIATHVNMH